MDPGYCDDLRFRDPGGFMYCPYMRNETPAPEELPQALRTALSAGNVPRAELATDFKDDDLSRAGPRSRY
jgi:hypothetical protein